MTSINAAGTANHYFVMFAFRMSALLYGGFYFFIFDMGERGCSNNLCKYLRQPLSIVFAFSQMLIHLVSEGKD